MADRISNGVEVGVLSGRAVWLRSLVASLLAIVFGLSPLSAADADSAQVIVRVNQKAITEGDLAFLYLARRVKDEMKPVVRERYINDLIDQTLLKEFLAERRVKAADRVVDEQVARLEKLIQREGLEFNEVLTSLGYTRESFREEVALPVAWRGYSRLAITDDAIKKYWDTHRSEFDGTEVKAAQIVKKIPEGASTADVAALAESLKQIRIQVETGKLTFAEAAKRDSDSPSAADGGRLGQFVLRGRMPIAISREAFALKPGEISGPFQTPFGMHLITVEEIIPGDLTLEDARRDIFNTLATQLQEQLIQQRRKLAAIKWAD